MARSTPALCSLRARGRATQADHVEWAIVRLEEGLDSPSLRILAGLTGEDAWETEDYYQRVARELQLVEPEAERCHIALACELCEDMVAGRLPLREGVRRLFRLCVDADYAAGYMPWLRLDDGLDQIESGLYPYACEELFDADVDTVIRTEAVRFLESHPLTAADR